jgi:hypothetical protein
MLRVMAAFSFLALLALSGAARASTRGDLSDGEFVASGGGTVSEASFQLDVASGENSDGEIAIVVDVPALKPRLITVLIRVRSTTATVAATAPSQPEAPLPPGVTVSVVRRIVPDRQRVAASPRHVAVNCRRRATPRHVRIDRTGSQPAIAV